MHECLNYRSWNLSRRTEGLSSERCTLRPNWERPTKLQNYALLWHNETDSVDNNNTLVQLNFCTSVQAAAEAPIEHGWSAERFKSVRSFRWPIRANLMYWIALLLTALVALSNGKSCKCSCLSPMYIAPVA